MPSTENIDELERRATPCSANSRRWATSAPGRWWRRTASAASPPATARDRAIRPPRLVARRPRQATIAHSVSASVARRTASAQFEQPVLPRGLGENRGTAGGGQVQVVEVHFDLRGADLPFPQGSPRRCLPCRRHFLHTAPVCRSPAETQPTPYPGIKVRVSPLVEKTFTLLRRQHFGTHLTTPLLIQRDQPFF